MGGGSQKVKSESKQTLPEYITGPAEYYSKTSLAEAQKPYEAYTQQRVAGFTPDQTQTFDMVRNNMGAWQPSWDQASSLAGQAGEGWSGDVAQHYMSPYQQNVTDIAAREMLRNEAIARNSRNADAVAAGAFGSAQAGVRDAEADRSLQQRIGDTYATGQANAWQSALGAFNADRAAQLGASQQLGSLANARQSLAAQDATQLLAIGGQEQQQKQNELDWQYQQWQEQQQYPWTQLSRGTSILGGLPYPTQTKTTGTQPGESMAGPAIGAAGTIAAAGIMVF